MNVAKGNYNGLVDELQMARNKDFSISQSESLITCFKGVSWQAACHSSTAIHGTLRKVVYYTSGDSRKSANTRW